MLDGARPAGGRQRDSGDERDREVWRKYRRDIAAIADMS
jgi:hypothetical protein